MFTTYMHDENSARLILRPSVAHVPYANTRQVKLSRKNSRPLSRHTEAAPVVELIDRLDRRDRARDHVAARLTRAHSCPSLLVELVSSSTAHTESVPLLAAVAGRATRSSTTSATTVIWQDHRRRQL